MAETGYFFDSVAGDRLYSAGSLVEYLYFLGGMSDGVLSNIFNKLEATGTGTLDSNIATGVALKKGRMYKNDAVLVKTHDAVAVGYRRYDRIIIRFDPTTTRAVAATIIKGTEVLIANPVTEPSVVADTDVKLCKVLITNTAGVYSYSYTDEREYFALRIGTEAPAASADGLFWMV